MSRRRPGHRGARPRCRRQPDGERLPFDNVTYDDKDDVLVVAVGGKDQRYPVVLRHLVHRPRELVLDQIRQGAAACRATSPGLPVEEPPA